MYLYCVDISSDCIYAKVRIHNYYIQIVNYIMYKITKKSYIISSFILLCCYSQGAISYTIYQI